MANILLHTFGTKWLKGLNTDFPSDASSIYGRISKLENIEKGFYAKFGATDYTSFMNKIRQLFGDSASDEKVFYRFRNDQLRSSLLRIQGVETSLYGFPITFQIKVDAEAVNKAINKNLKKGLGEIGKVTDGIYEATIELNRENLRRIANEVFGGKAKQGKLSFDSIKKSFDDAIEKNPEQFLYIGMGGEGLSLVEFQSQFEKQARSFPWGYTIEELRKAEQDADSKSRLRLELTQAKEVIQNYIFNTLGQGASQELKEAIEEVWNQKIGEGFETLSFFSGGNKGTFINTILGALGEFQYAILLKYLDKKCKRLGISPEIVADTKDVNQAFAAKSAKGEKGKTDVVLQHGRRWGTQIKNYNLYNTNDRIGTNIHLYHFTALAEMPANQANDFLTFVSNVFFNEDYGAQEGDKLEALEDTFLVNEIASVLSLQSSYEVNDTVAFYFIGGTYLVPGSVILRAIAESQKKILGKISITSSYTPTSEHDFHHTIYENPESKSGKVSYLYTKYWTRDPNAPNGWTPTDENKKEALNLVTSGISIRTSFNYKNIIQESMSIYLRK